jgi:hypothetical protein
MWFEDLTGFREESPEQVRRHISVDGTRLKSHVNDKEYICGRLEIASLAELRGRVIAEIQPTGKISVREKLGNVQAMHQEVSNAGALFQVASQFNLLEMVSPNVTPEQGIAGYEYDATQGPACAIAAGAGTIYRNYFADLDGQLGQTVDRQIDCLSDLGQTLGNRDNRLWEMRNGYALASREGLTEISRIIDACNDAERDDLKKLLRIGLQWNTEVTLGPSHHTVTQAYCSALPVAYSQQPSALWESFARLILEASYEATLCAGLLNARETGNSRVYLTLLGGGVFGNSMSWITDAIRYALDAYKIFNLEVYIVSFRRSNDAIKELISQF